MRVVHAGLDPGIQVLVAHAAQGGFAVDLGLLCRPDDVAGHNDRDLTDAGQVGVEKATLNLLGKESLGEGLTRGVDHAVGDLDRLGKNSTQTNTREDIHVVALAGVVGAGLASSVGVGHGGEGRTRGKQHAAIGVGDGALVVTFGLVRGVGQREDNGGSVPLGHLAQELGGEDTTDGRKTHQDGGLHMVNNIFQGLQLQAVVVRTGKVDLVISELVTTISSDKTLSVDQVETRAGLILGHTLADEEVNNLLSNTDTGATSTKEDGALVLARKARALDSVDDTTEDDSASTLDVIVEAGVVVTVTLQSREGVLEVLELDHNTATRKQQSSRVDHA